MQRVHARQLGVPKKAVVIDDREENRSFYTRRLEDAGFAVQSADGFRTGSRLVEAEFFHVAAVDLSLVGNRNRDGLRIIHRLYQELKEGTEAILLSAYGTMEVGARAKDYGCFEVIEKENVEPAAFSALAERAYQKSLDALTTYHVSLNFLSGAGDAKATHIWSTNVLRSLDAGGFSYVDSFTKNLLMHLFPLLRLSSGRPSELDEKARLVKGLYWSKMLGKPILIEIGPPDAIQNEAAEFEQSNEGKPDELRESVLIIIIEKQLAGLVFSLAEPQRHEFEEYHDVRVRYPRP